MKICDLRQKLNNFSIFDMIQLLYFEPISHLNCFNGYEGLLKHKVWQILT